MLVHVAQLAGSDHSADRVFQTSNAVIVLDGASAFEPVDVNPATYAGTLGEAIADQLDAEPNGPLPDAVSAAITHASSKLHLATGRSPSSTVSILRIAPEQVDLYALGDSPIHYGTNTVHTRFADDRLDTVAIRERDHYRARLRAGHGYGETHREALAALQRAQHAVRNQPGGYWIAETDPDAARHAVTAAVPYDAITWAVLATDGAADPIDYIGDDWAAIAQTSPSDLSTLLHQLHHWEAALDPDGRTLTRAKRHDDKTLASIPVVR